MNNFEELLNSLTKREFKRFTCFINSPFFNSRSDILRLTEYVSQKLPLGRLDREELYRHIYGSGKYSPQVILNLLSRMKSLLEQFLITIRIEKDEEAQVKALAEELANRGMYRNAERVLEKGILKLEDEIYTANYLKKYYEYTELRESYLVNNKQHKLKAESSFQRGQAAVNFFILNLLRIANDIVVFRYVNTVLENKVIFNGIFSFFDFKGYLENLKDLNSPYFVMTAVYYYGLMSKMNDPQKFHRNKLRDIVFNNLDELKYHDQATCWTMLFASYIFTSTPQKENASEEVHEINKLFVSKGILTRDEQGFFIETSYHNIAFQAINAKDYDWAERFLDQYRSELPPGTTDYTYNSCMARCKFNRGDYDACLNFLSRMKIENVVLRLNISTLAIRCYYELGYYEEAASAIEALSRIYSSNKELTLNLKRTLRDFIKYSRILVKARASGKKIPAAKYQSALNGPGFSARGWVLEKMKELVDGSA